VADEVTDGVEPESTVVGLGVPGLASGGHEVGAVVVEVDKSGVGDGWVGKAGGLRLCPPHAATDTASSRAPAPDDNAATSRRL
jgi:hypothetical protein